MLRLADNMFMCRCNWKTEMPGSRWGRPSCMPILPFESALFARGAHEMLQLLGAKPNRAPPLLGPTPGWLEPTVLKQWSSPRSHYPGDLVGLPAGRYLWPARALRVVRANWVNPIQAAMFPGASLTARPRLSFQLRFVAWKAVRLVRGFSRDLRAWRDRPT